MARKDTTGTNTHIAVNTIQYGEKDSNDNVKLVTVEAGKPFAPSQELIDELTPSGAIREITKDDVAVDADGNAVDTERTPGPVGYADNTSVGQQVYPGGVSNPNDIPSVTAENAQASVPTGDSDELDSKLPSSRSTKR